MRKNALLVRLADHLGLSDPSPLSGGEFGAILVRDVNGRALILKALPSPSFAERYARGARMAMRLRDRGYPAPEYIGTGVALGASWSLQTRIPGLIPETPSPAHIRTLLALAERHAGAAGERAHTRDQTLSQAASAIMTVASDPRTRPLGKEIAAAVRAVAGVELLDDGVVHGDFHHRNFLAVGDDVTGVFDWDGAHAGDWRADVANLAFWCALLPGMIPPETGRIAIDRMHDVCPPGVRAFFAAAMAARQLDFDVRHHPERVDGLVTAIEAAVAPWWRAAVR